MGFQNERWHIFQIDERKSLEFLAEQLLEISRVFYSLVASLQLIFFHLQLIFFHRTDTTYPYHLFYFKPYIPINLNSYLKLVSSWIPTDKFTLSLLQNKNILYNFDLSIINFMYVLHEYIYIYIYNNRFFYIF